MATGVDRNPKDLQRLWRAVRKLMASGQAHEHVGNEIPAGAIDGANRVFTLAHKPRASSLQLFKNGLYMTQGADADYTVADLTITFSADQVPELGCNLRAFYVVA